MQPVGNNDRQVCSSLRAAIAGGLVVAGFLLLVVPQLYAANQALNTSLQGSIKALDSARQTALRELENLPLATAEAADYTDFVLYLNTRIVSYCMELAKQGGESALEGLPCPAGPMGSGFRGPATASGEEVMTTTGTGMTDPRTEAEKTADLDEDFLSALGDFDDMLLKEEGKVAVRVPTQRESSASAQSGASGRQADSGGAAESGGGESVSAGERGAASAGNDVANGGNEGQGDRSGEASGAQRSAGAGDSEVANPAYGAPGGKLPPPKDDDIVARQLREAAEKEPDPELKKKLWEEYWKYKGRKK